MTQSCDICRGDRYQSRGRGDQGQQGTQDWPEAQEGNEEGVAKEDVGDDCEADSLDSAIDPDEQRALPPASVSTTSLWQRFLINRWV